MTQKAMNRYIKNGIEQFVHKGMEPWHMPGHKRRRQSKAAVSSLYDAIDAACEWDVTELPMTDDYLRPEGFFEDALEELKNVYGSRASFYLVNGSTSGLHIAIAACAKRVRKSASERGTGILLAAVNCHRSVFNAARLLGLEVVSVDVRKLEGGMLFGGADAGKIADALMELDDLGRVCAAVITSPTYEGVCSDIRSIKNLLDGYGIPLIVDEAHGAHMVFSEELKALSGLSSGADIVVQSLHKTLPSPTQTAIMHVMSDRLVDMVREYVEVFLSSSPSFILLAAMERAVADADEHRRRFDEWVRRVRVFKERVNAGIKDIRVFVPEAGVIYDDTRIVLMPESGSGLYLADCMVRAGVAIEMAEPGYVVLISTVADTEEDFERLYDMLKEALRISCSGEDTEPWYGGHTPDADIEALKGSSAMNDIYAYPPGNPIALKGEVIDDGVVDKIKEYMNAGKKIYGI